MPDGSNNFELNTNNHNDLDAAAEVAINKITTGEKRTFEGWLEYGSVLLRGRKAYPGDTEFGQWKSLVLACCDDFRPHPEEEAAAMWAVENPNLFQKVREEFPLSRTVRGLYAKYKANVEQFAKPDWMSDQTARQEDVKAGRTVLANKKTDLALIGWAKDNRLAVDIMRPGDWGNPFVEGQDGNRDQVIQKYKAYLDGKPSLQKRIDDGELTGKVLICCCAPEPCHGDVLIEEIEASDFDVVDDEVEADANPIGRATEPASEEPRSSVANEIIRSAQDKAATAKVLDGIVDEIFYDGCDPDQAWSEAMATKEMLLQAVSEIEARLEDMTAPVPAPGPLLQMMEEEV